MRCVSILTVLATAASIASQSAVELRSPDENVRLWFSLTDRGESRDCPTYRVDFHGRPVLLDSALGMWIEDAPLTCGFEIVRHVETEHDGRWHPVYGERSTVRDHYRQLEVELRERVAPHRTLVLTFRAYDTGIAFCYNLPAEPGTGFVRIVAEQSGFRFAGDPTAWVVSHAQGRYSEVRLGELQSETERPLTLRLSDDLWAAVGEARLVDYARMRLKPAPGGVSSALAGPVESALPMTTPWRVVMLADSPARLLEQNDLFLSLNDPCQLTDTSWIRPGKVIREMTLTTTGARACVDFAAANGLQFIEFDAGWYGPEHDDASDATAVRVDPKRSSGPLDLPEAIRYAEERGIGVILYVNRRALERQLDEILPLYREWGVAGVKFGFVQVGSQRWTRWLHEAVRKAADERLMVDVHDEYRPTGYSRTFPNLMTQEGIAGDETRPSSRQTLTILFTRMLAGAGDNTICYYNPRVDEVQSHGFQLAKAVCLYSPWQFLYWYDRPDDSRRGVGGAGDSSGVIGDEPELEFFARLPTVWDDTRVLCGAVGKYAVIARRRGEEWFVGGMNGEMARTLELPLGFLPDGEFVASVYTDDEGIKTRTRVRIERCRVRRDTVMSMTIASSHGFAAWLRPAGTGDRELPRCR